MADDVVLTAVAAVGDVPLVPLVLDELAGLVTVLVLVAVLRCEPVVANDAVHTAEGVGSDVLQVPLVLAELLALAGAPVRVAVVLNEPVVAETSYLPPWPSSATCRWSRWYSTSWSGWWMGRCP